MKHLYSSSVFEEYTDLPGEGSPAARLKAWRLDGFELFTLFDPVQTKYLVPETVGVHLPYAIDWHSAWEGRAYDGAESQDPRFFSLGRDRPEMERNLATVFATAAAAHPAYGVLHAGNTDLRQVLMPRHRSDDMRIIADFAELMDETAKRFGQRGLPVRPVFENLWWEGLKLRSPAEWQLFEQKLEIDDWGFCLDTGHLMNTCPAADDEDSAIESILRIIDRYPQDMRDRITNMHLQLSASGPYRRSLTPDAREPHESFDAFYRRAADRAAAIDQHRPFSSPKVREIVDAVRPDFLIHELMGRASGDRFADLRQQRALFP